MNFSYFYELMRAYPDSNLLVNKHHVGCIVNKFVRMNNAFYQIIRVDGEEIKVQFIRFSISSFAKREKAIIKHLKKIENKFGENNIIPIDDEKILMYNTYWDVSHIGLTHNLLDDNAAMIVLPDGKKMYFSLETGKGLSDVWQVVFKPLPYFGSGILM